MIFLKKHKNMIPYWW